MSCHTKWCRVNTGLTYIEYGYNRRILLSNNIGNIFCFGHFRWDQLKDTKSQKWKGSLYLIFNEMYLKEKFSQKWKCPYYLIQDHPSCIWLSLLSQREIKVLKENCEWKWMVLNVDHFLAGQNPHLSSFKRLHMTPAKNKVKWWVIFSKYKGHFRPNESSLKSKDM